MPTDGEGEGMLTGEEEVTDNGPIGYRPRGGTVMDREKCIEWLKKPWCGIGRSRHGRDDSPVECQE